VSSDKEEMAFTSEVLAKDDALSGLYRKFKKLLTNVGYGSMTVFIESLRNTYIGGSDTTNIGGTKTTAVAKQFNIQAGEGLQLTAKTKLGANARTLDLTAVESIHINVGKSRLSLEKNGRITLAGAEVNIVTEHETNLESNGETTIKSAVNITAKAPKINLN
jgi:hypothetical protein